MTRKTCPLGDDCDLTVAWMAGRESAKDELEANLAMAVEALKECVDEIDAYIQFEYPSDHPVHERYRQRDYAANPARIALAELVASDD
jgi:hypothetical protein